MWDWGWSGGVGRGNEDLVFNTDSFSLGKWKIGEMDNSES